MKWQLNKIQYPLYNLGPGKRIGIWVQGCSIHCPHCINKMLWKRDGGEAIPVVDVFNWILKKSEDFDGITISGGEPFDQYEQLIAFLYLVKNKTKLNTYVFTGYYLHELYKKFENHLFTAYTDFLMDGRYVESKHDNNNTKGSQNQTLYHFINGIPYPQSIETNTNIWSLKVDDKGGIYMAGIPKNEDMKKLCQDLGKAGIEKSFM
ncbi:MAG: 4Fe-4S single cluster domain-containing protein [Bacteroidales bacterium]|nr:4Fe-4S single cluster domain-containing protein [Bacteroidales bacterium]